MAAMGDAGDAIEPMPPALVKPAELWTGKQLFSLLIRPNSRVKCAVPFHSGLRARNMQCSSARTPTNSVLSLWKCTGTRA